MEQTSEETLATTLVTDAVVAKPAGPSKPPQQQHQLPNTPQEPQADKNTNSDADGADSAGSSGEDVDDGSAADHDSGDPAGVSAQKLRGGGGRLPPELWEARRRFNNLGRRERAKRNRKAKVEAARLAREASLAPLALTPEQRAELEDREREARVAAHLAQMAKVDKALQDGQRIAIDCSFVAGSTNLKEVRSLLKQVECSLAANKHAPAPASLHLTSWRGSVEGCALSMGGNNWRATRHPGATQEVFPLDQLVVLSPDAPEPLAGPLDPAKVYVVGGIVDRSVRPNMTRDFAAALQLQARRLPISEHAAELGMTPGNARRLVLNVNDVVVALLEANHSGDWLQALDKAIPQRKRRDKSQGSAKRKAPSEAGAEAVAAGEGGAQAGEAAGPAAPGQQGEQAVGGWCWWPACPRLMGRPAGALPCRPVG